MPDTLPDTLKEALDSEILLDQWDEPPHLHMVLVAPGESPRLLPLPIPEWVWGQFIPFDVLTHMAEMIITSPPITLDRSISDVEGLVFFCEGWSLKSKKDDPESAKRIQEYAENHSIEEHPDRIEVKMISAVTKDGDRYLTVYERGEPEPLELLVTHKDDPEEKETGVDGRIFEALETVLTNFLAKVVWTNG